jgi:FkbM family methyltransferase
MSAEQGLARWSKLLRFVPSGLGAHAAARAVIARSEPLPRAVIPQELWSGAVVELDVSDREQAQVYLIRRYEPDLVALITRLVPPAGLFFDVGANIGLITLAVGARRPDISIVAFEPDPINAARWRHNLELNGGPDAVLEEVALGNASGRAELVRGDESGWSYIAGANSEQGVEVVTLDAYVRTREIPVIDAVKIDVEGYELFVLQGAASVLEDRRIRSIVCELDESLLERNGHTRGDVISLLRGFGYRARPIPPVSGQRLHRRSVETSRDLLFLPTQTC